MGGHGVSGPNRAEFSCGVVANREGKIELGRGGDGKLVPEFAAQAGGGYVRDFELAQGFGANASRRMTAGAERR
jgi:hypothetical protein